MKKLSRCCCRVLFKLQDVLIPASSIPVVPRHSAPPFTRIRRAGRANISRGVSYKVKLLLTRSTISLTRTQSRTTTSRYAAWPFSILLNCGIYVRGKWINCQFGAERADV